MAYINVPVTGTATLIVAGNSQRLNVIVTNNSAIVCYIGQDNLVTTTTGIQMAQNDVLTDDNSGMRGYLGPIYGITSGSTADIRYWERTQ